MKTKKSKLISSIILLLLGVYIIVLAFLPRNSTYELEETERYATTIKYLKFDIDVGRYSKETYWATFDTERERCFFCLSSNSEKKEQEKNNLEQFEKTQKEIVISTIERTNYRFKDSVQVIDIRDDSQVYLSYEDYNDDVIGSKIASVFCGIFIFFIVLCNYRSEIGKMLSAKQNVKKGKYKETEYKQPTRPFSDKTFKERAVIYVVLTIFVAAIPAALSFSKVTVSSFEESDTTFEKVTFNDWRISSDAKNLELFSAQFEDEFIIRDYEKYVDNLKELKSDCNGKEVFNVWYIHKTSEKTGSLNIVYQISKDDNIIFSFDDMRNVNKDYLEPFIIGGSVLSLLCLSMVILLLLILCKPEKFELLFVRLFAK